MTKTEFKAEAKAAFQGFLGTIAEALQGIAEVEREAAMAAAVFEVRIGMTLDSVRNYFTEAKAAGVDISKVAGIGTSDWREWARENVPGRSNGTLYRWQNAGAVAKVLGDELVPRTLIGGLAHLYRGISSASLTEDERTAAEDLVREVYREAVEEAKAEDGTVVPPTPEALLAKAEAAFPSNRSGGGSKAKGKTKAEATEDDSTEDESDSRRESSDSLTVVDAAAVERASGPVDSVLRGVIAEYGVTYPVAIGIMLAALRLGSEHGNGNVTAVLATASMAAEDQAAEDAKAA